MVCWSAGTARPRRPRGAAPEVPSSSWRGSASIPVHGAPAEPRPRAKMAPVNERLDDSRRGRGPLKVAGRQRRRSDLPGPAPLVGVKSRADRPSVLVDALHRGADELKLTGHGGGPRDARASERREGHRPAVRGAQQIDQALRVVACRAPGIDRRAGSCAVRRQRSARRSVRQQRRRPRAPAARV